MNYVNQLSFDRYQFFLAEVLNYFGGSSAGISVIDDQSPHRIQTPAIRIDNVLYEGPVRFGQALVILQRRFFQEKYRELEALASDE